MNKKTRILFIINPISGVGKSQKAQAAIEAILNKDKFEHEIVYTQYAHHATILSQEVARLNSFDIVAAIGGDGSINDCARGLAGSDIPLAIVPAGSGNGLARALKVPMNIRKAIKIINDNQSCRIDTVKLNDSVYVSIAGIGFDALIAQKFAKTKTRGFNAYFQLIARRYVSYIPKTYTLEIGGTRHKTKALFICFANSNQFGYDALVAPSASLTDGYMDVICVKKIPVVLLPLVAGFLFTKRFEHSIFVTAYKTKQVKVFNTETMGINIDGEYMEKEGDLQIAIQEKNLSVIIPKTFSEP